MVAFDYDPVAAGLVESLNRPGGNVTGITIFGTMAAGKRLELLRQLMPKAGIVAYLTNPRNPNREIETVRTAAHTLGQQLLVLNASNDRELDAAFVALAQQQIAALLFASDSLFFDRREQLVAGAAIEGALVREAYRGRVRSGRATRATRLPSARRRCRLRG